MTVTSLAFRRAGPGRHPVPHKNKTVGGRRLGLEMQGNIYSLGYFSANVCLGTPAQRFDVIIDTGSSLTAVPCADCSHCGRHQHPTYVSARYDSLTSSTFSAAGSRPYSVSYTEGSSIRGRIVRDVAWFEELGAGRRVDCPATFGCQTHETGLFNSQVADGISGLSRSRAYGATLFDALRGEDGRAGRLLDLPGRGGGRPRPRRRGAAGAATRVGHVQRRRSLHGAAHRGEPRGRRQAGRAGGQRDRRLGHLVHRTLPLTVTVPLALPLLYHYPYPYP